VQVSLGGREFTVTRARLGGFLRLQYIRSDLLKGVETRDTGAIVRGVFAFLRQCLGSEADETAPWTEVWRAYQTCEDVNALPDGDRFNILRYPPGGKAPVWDFPMRSIVWWVHCFATAYGWSKEMTLDLWPEEAIALLQEIEAEDWAEREFQHALSQVAYVPDGKNKMRYKPMDRPAWMQMRKGGPKKVRIPKSALPLGSIVYPAGTPEDMTQ
jgi:hypothetical protein